MANTIDRDQLTIHRDLLLDNYRCELNRLESRLDGARQRFELGTGEGRGTTDPVHHHDAFNMAAVCQELARLAGQIETANVVLRSLKAE